MQTTPNGGRRARKRDAPWIFRTYAGHSSAAESNRLFRDNLAKIGCAPTYLPHAAFAAFIADDLKKWRQLIPAMGIPPIE